MSLISPLAAVDPKARLASDVSVGPFCVIGPDVTIGSGCKLLNHVTITGLTTIGEGNTFFPNSVIGTAPQDRKFRGAVTRLEIGDGNVFREAVTLHVGTEKGGGVTRVANNNLFMINAHVGHDAQMGSNCTISNNVMIAGHVVIGDNVAMMGGVGVHHFVTIGDFAYIGGYARVHHDVPPYCKIDGADTIRGLNAVGLRRAGVSEADIEALEDACRRLFYREKPFSVAMAEFDTMNGLNPYVKQMITFLKRRDAGKHGRYLESLRAK
jgi:UDP-N-acetylglucosamine acyltransferase